MAVITSTEPVDYTFIGFITESLVVRLNFAIFSYIRSSYVSSTIDVARTVLTNLSLLDPPIKDF